ncbi:MAG: urea transporter [Cyanobacteria bacterium TGS_CYA1]|nr:urea transporter [Cyanobacteria bacterium TGS_CYA1]
MKTVASVFLSYGSFFGLSHPLSISLLFLCSMLCPLTGITGLLGASLVLLIRRLLGFSKDSEAIEVINGLLLGMLVGSLYVPGVQTLLLLLFGSVLVVLSSAVFNDILTRAYKLPVLGVPYVFSGCVLISLAQTFKLPLLTPGAAFTFFSLIPFPELAWTTTYISGIGSIYFSGTLLGAILVLLAFLASSPYLAALTLGLGLVVALTLQAIHIPLGSITALVAQMNGVLTGAVIGGLYTKPGFRSIFIAILSAMLAAILSLAIEHHLWALGLPALAMPFVISTHAILMALSPLRGGVWSKFWLLKPALPEVSIEEQKIAEIRGVDQASVAVRLPVSGIWSVYQGFGGKHTHQKEWHYSIDLFKLEEERSFDNDGTKVTDYHCFGQPVLAPVYGTVVDFCNHHKDNIPGEVDLANNWGNYIIIQLDTSGYLVLAHLQENSVRINKYDRVVPGQELALCGNSGRSPQPHLHMSIHTNMNLASQTIPFHFTHVIIIDGQSQLYTLCSRPKETEKIMTPARNTALKRAFHLNVGSRLQFDTTFKGKEGVSIFDVILDPTGQFYLVSDKGAFVAFSITDDLVAFWGRQGADDSVLDAFILAIGLSPLIEGQSVWHDLVPRHLLPANYITQLYNQLLNPFNNCTKSRLTRSWEPLKNTWNQTATQKLKSCAQITGTVTYTTTAKLCETLGLVSIEMKENDKSILKATLVGQSRRADNGIPGVRSIIRRENQSIAQTD